jgi:hypothetical protein
VGEQSVLEIGVIALEWSEWTPWPNLVADNRGGAGVSIPNQVPGVYEVRVSGANGSERLYIGKAGDLRLRVRQGLVKGKIPHPGGTRIRAQEDVARLLVRWAVTGRPAAAEEELHQAYRRKFGRPPAYVKNM